MSKYIAIDTEHGGFDEDNNPLSLLELALVIYDENWNEIKAECYKLKPNDGILSVTGEALDVNKIIIPDHIKVAKTYNDVKSDIFNWLRTHSNDGAQKLQPVGHSVQGDIQLINKCLLKRNTWNHVCTRRILDTQHVTQYLRRKGVIPSHVSGSLGSLCKFFDIELVNAHTALADARASALLMKKLLEI